MSDINWSELGSLVEMFAPQLDQGLKNDATRELAETIVLQAVGVPREQVIESIKNTHLQATKDALQHAQFRFKKELEKQSG